MFHRTSDPRPSDPQITHEHYGMPSSANIVTKQRTGGCKRAPGNVRAVVSARVRRASQHGIIHAVRITDNIT